MIQSKLEFFILLRYETRLFYILYFICSEFVSLDGVALDLFTLFGVNLWLMLLWICIWLFQSSSDVPSGSLS